MYYNHQVSLSSSGVTTNMHLPTNTGKVLFLVSLLSLFSSIPVHADSPVWQVERNGNLTFIGGTFHVLTEADYPLPAGFDKAYQQSALVIFETDIEKLESPEFQQAMLRELSYSDGRNLQQVLHPETYLALGDYFAARGIPIASVVNYKPGLVATLMMVIELQRLGLDGEGVDTYFSTKTTRDQKQRGQLESVDDQIQFIANMGIGREDELLAFNLEDLEKLPGMWKSMKDSWRNGDMPKLYQETGISLKNDFPEIYQSLLVERNDAWMPQIEALLKTTEVEFVLVGALHLAGEDGLLSRLAARGYKVRQLP
jgi:uncharacterized protein YbaP (TraB family)